MLQYLTSFAFFYIIMAHILPHRVIRNIRNNRVGHTAQSGNGSSSQDIFRDDDFHPTPKDIYVVRAMLGKAKLLPPDLVDMIFEHAEYWAHSSNELDFNAEHQAPLLVQATSQTEDKFLLRSYPVGLTHVRDRTELPKEQELSEELAWDTHEAPPLPLGNEHDPKYFKKIPDYPTPKLVSPVRKVVFSIRSKDQGWGGSLEDRGTYKGSWTWFEAGLERFDADQTCDPQCTYDARHTSPSSTASPLPVCGLRSLYPAVEADSNDEGKLKYKHTLQHNTQYEIQRNKTAVKDYQDNVVTWSYLDNVRSDSDEAMKIDEEEGRGRETLDGSFVRDLKLGDVVTIWAKARFPGWVNHIEKVKIEVYWAV